MRSIVVKGHKVIDEIVKASNEVIAQFYPELSVHSFTFSSLYQVALGSNAKKSIPEVFGQSRFWRWKLHFKNLRKKKQIPDIKMKLPQDAVIFYREEKAGFIISSPSYNFALKIFLDPPHKELLDAEILTLKKIKGSPFESDASSYIADGVTSNGARWVLTDFRSNRDSLRHHMNPDKLFYDLAYTQIMPRMKKFYELQGIERIHVKDYLVELTKRLESHPDSEFLNNEIAKLMNEDFELIQSFIHYDLHAGNVLRSGESYSIIDWEGNLKNLILIDGLDFVRRLLQKDHLKLKTFISLWKKGSLTSEVETALQSFLSWQKAAFSLDYSVVSSHTLLRLYALERTILFWEVRKVNRLTDKRGFEKAILQF